MKLKVITLILLMGIVLFSSAECYPDNSGNAEALSKDNPTTQSVPKGPYKEILLDSIRFYEGPDFIELPIDFVRQKLLQTVNENEMFEYTVPLTYYFVGYQLINGHKMACVVRANYLEAEAFLFELEGNLDDICYPKMLKFFKESGLCIISDYSISGEKVDVTTVIEADDCLETKTYTIPDFKTIGTRRDSVDEKELENFRAYSKKLGT